MFEGSTGWEPNSDEIAFIGAIFSFASPAFTSKDGTSECNFLRVVSSGSLGGLEELRVVSLTAFRDKGVSDSTALAALAEVRVANSSPVM
jgi:hypothetical protein